MATPWRFDLNSVHHPFREAVAPQPMHKWRSDERRLARKRINLSRLNANIKAVRLYAHLGRFSSAVAVGGKTIAFHSGRSTNTRLDVIFLVSEHCIPILV